MRSVGADQQMGIGLVDGGVLLVGQQVEERPGVVLRVRPLLDLVVLVLADTDHHHVGLRRRLFLRARG